MNRHLEIIGTAMILLALAHVFFPKHFGWKKELASLSLLARQMMYVHTAFIALAVLLMGVLCLTAPAELVGTPLGRKIALGLAPARSILRLLPQTLARQTVRDLYAHRVYNPLDLLNSSVRDDRHRKGILIPDE